MDQSNNYSNKNSQEQIEYDVFYDECKEDGYWHCFLFVPKDKIEDIHQLIIKARQYSSFNDTIHYKNITAKTKKYAPNVQFVRILIDILLYILQQQKVDACIHWGKHKIDKYENKIGAKLTIFRKIYDRVTRSENQKTIEATFRMGLKGALHYLFQDEHPIINNIYVDYSDENFNNQFRASNMWEKVKGELRDNISYTHQSEIKCISKNKYNLDSAESQFMQFVDVIVGAFRTCINKNVDFKARYYATKSMLQLIKKEYTNKARMENSRYFKGYIFSEAYLEDDKWVFRPMKIKSEQEQIDIFQDDDLR